MPSLPRVRSTRTGPSGPLQGAAAASASMGGLRTSGPSGLRRTRPPIARRRPPIASRLALEADRGRFRPQHKPRE
ncbi:hypothetical protein OO17_24830 [Rhodopseudomonas palustris]|uniref:Uncharacterized protein n=1 Tax=Rhodopseudomonas palustris TaxID=1076 RepID=A0A0D7E747_RHOPL|nr:hypothetical protein OO17_24830 [Rhodopseudomonas palustris]